MRLFVLLYSLIFLSFPAFAQNDNLYPQSLSSEIPDPFPLPNFPIVDGEVVYQKIFEFDEDRQKLYGIALKYVSEYYKSAKAVIDLNDPVNGILIVKGNFNTEAETYFRFFGVQKGLESYLTFHTLTIECKDQRIRVTINGLKARDNFTGIEIPVESMISEYRNYSYLGKPKKAEVLSQINRSAMLKELDLNSKAFILGLEPYFEKQLKDDW